MSARRIRSRLLAPGAMVAIVVAVLAGPIRAWASAPAPDAGSAPEAAQLIERMRTAPLQYDFTGRAIVSWHTHGKLRHAEVDVRGAGGSLEILAGARAVFDDGRRTYVREDGTWTSLLIEPSARSLPDPTEHWKLSARAGRVIAGRPTTLVVVSRSDGSAAQRLFVDDATGLLLGREVLGSNGRVERSLSVAEIDLSPTSTAVDLPTHARAQAAQSLGSVPDGYRAPRSPGAGYELVTRSRHRDGVLFFYSDGIFSASVFEQRGDLAWDSLPAGGTTLDISGNRTVRYDEPSGEALVWESGGIVYTTVSDAPSDVFERMVGELAPTDRNAPESVVDFVLGPFGWG